MWWLEGIVMQSIIWKLIVGSLQAILFWLLFKIVPSYLKNKKGVQKNFDREIKTIFYCYLEFRINEAKLLKH